MKTKILLILFLLTAFIPSYSQEKAAPSSFQQESFFYAGKVWGFVKYYHPEARIGKFDMDSLLVVLLDKSAETTTLKERNTVLNEWVAQFGKIKESEKFIIKDSSQYKQLYDYSWLSNSTFDKKLSKTLNEIKNAKRNDTCHYAVLNVIDIPDLSNEKATTPDFSKKHQKLTSLFRYWNVIEYYFPYKYLTDKRWDEVLKEYIPIFLKAQTIPELDKATLWLTMDINDSHSMCRSEAKPNAMYPYKRYGSPIQFVYANGKFIVNGLWYYIKTSGKVSDYGMELGDELIAVNGRDPKDIIKKDVAKYFSTSNFNELCNNTSDLLLLSDTTSIEITYKRNNKTHSNRIKTSRFEYQYGGPASKEALWIKDSIAYIYFPDVCLEPLIDSIQAISQTKGVVIDMRGYANCLHYDIATLFNSENRPFEKTSSVNPHIPGNFKARNSHFLARCFPIRMNNYGGKIIVLVDYNTLSNAEYNTMRLQVLPNVTTIGSQTAGTDGNMTQIMLHNDLLFSFSSLGIYYPDGRETQRAGLRLDEEVYHTPQGIKEGRDEVLRRAIEIINQD